ncbi:sigma-70 family RNA polymerase sigma factor [Sphingobacterium sp. SYP-B4668]|uniref:sigma-70 family RNA polymerase sigma factor n=1 Tax=Sphingobacterium sp. SYP-B4668 TaxID=2996035 RepID=UPI0022DCEB6F|nr:sigma-70 family RNA polymerase sigma factor [Sphingobacterium sp. SYP-B4668]
MSFSKDAEDIMLLNTKVYTEQEFLYQISIGNRDAFTAFYMLHHQELGRTIGKFIKNREQTEELVQEVFVKLWLKRDILAKVENIRSYLFVLAKNTSLNTLKKNIRVETERIEWLRSEETQIRNQVQEIDESAYYQLLDRAIDNLPPQQKKVYLLSRSGRKKYVEIAEELQISKETVKKYLQLANASIVSYLQKNKDFTFLFILLFLRA